MCVWKQMYVGVFRIRWLIPIMHVSEDKFLEVCQSSYEKVWVLSMAYIVT